MKLAIITTLFILVIALAACSTQKQAASEDKMMADSSKTTVEADPEKALESELTQELEKMDTEGEALEAGLIG